MKKTILKLTMLAGLFVGISITMLSCSKDKDDTPTPTPSNTNNPNNPAPKFDAKKNLIINILDTDYNPGASYIYVDYHVKNTNATQSYNINDDEWDILFKIKATDGYEFSNNVNVLSVEAESDYDHGLPINVSTGKTLDLSTLTYEIVPSID